MIRMITMLRNVHAGGAFPLGIHTAQFYYFIASLQSELNCYMLQCQISLVHVSPFCPSSCVHCHFYLALLITVYSVVF